VLAVEIWQYAGKGLKTLVSRVLGWTTEAWSRNPAARETVERVHLPRRTSPARMPEWQSASSTGQRERLLDLVGQRSPGRLPLPDGPPGNRRLLDPLGHDLRSRRDPVRADEDPAAVRRARGVDSLGWDREEAAGVAQGFGGRGAGGEILGGSGLDGGGDSEGVRYRCVCRVGSFSGRAMHLKTWLPAGLPLFNRGCFCIGARVAIISTCAVKSASNIPSTLRLGLWHQLAWCRQTTLHTYTISVTV
jgi:hypothetical protein